MIYTTPTQATNHALRAAGQQLGKLLRQPAIGGRHLVVEADRLRSLGSEGHQEQAPWCQDTHLHFTEPRANPS